MQIIVVIAWHRKVIAFCRQKFCIARDCVHSCVLIGALSLGLDLFCSCVQSQTLSRIFYRREFRLDWAMTKFLGFSRCADHVLLFYLHGGIGLLKAVSTPFHVCVGGLWRTGCAMRNMFCYFTLLSLVAIHGVLHINLIVNLKDIVCLNHFDFATLFPLVGANLCNCKFPGCMRASISKNKLNWGNVMLEERWLKEGNWRHTLISTVSHCDGNLFLQYPNAT